MSAPSSMMRSIFFFACRVNSAKRVRMTNSPGRTSGSMVTLLGKRERSLRAPQGRTWLEVRVAGTLSSGEIHRMTFND